MRITRNDYLMHYLDRIDMVIDGRYGSISEDRYLVNNYQPEFFSVLDTQLGSTDAHVRAETVMLLTSLRERSAADRIAKMRYTDTDSVAGACVGYLSAMGEEDRMIPDLLEKIRYGEGEDFRSAAKQLGKAGRPQDIPAIRKIYGRVPKDMHDELYLTLSDIVDRFPELKSKRQMILSDPIFPNEDAFLRFADRAMVYFDIKYRDRVEPAQKISESAFVHISGSIEQVQVRLYNERDNLRIYGQEARDQFRELEEILIWAAEDLAGKTVVRSQRPSKNVRNSDAY